MMNDDPRAKNRNIPGSTASEFFKNYQHSLNAALQSMDLAAMDCAYELMLVAATQTKTIYTAGNGGSTAIAGHLMCDWAKGTFNPPAPSLRIHALSSNMELLTAIGNDFGFEYVFSRQLEMFAKSGDLLVLISSSGNSPNIVKAAEVARSKNMPIIGFTGFTGGKLKDLATVSLHADSHNYAVVEDCHQAAMQALGLFFFLKQAKL